MANWLVMAWETAAGFVQINGWAILRTALIIAVVIFAAGPVARRADHLARGLFQRFRKKDGATPQDKRAATVGTLVGSIVRYVVWAVAIAICLSALGLSGEAGNLLAAAGISGGLIIGFGAQKLLQDFFAGFIFVTDHPFAVGDIVTIDGRTGVVESLKLRTTTLRAITGERHIFPNGSIGVVTNLSVYNALAICDIYIPTRHTLEEISPILHDAALKATEGNEDVVEPPQVLGITGFTDRGMMCARTICRVRPATHWAMERTLRAALLAALVEKGILQ